ncbi:hypothetical protein GCM10009541_32390 [Micromonospora gifhornensis]|uniref:Uncharacterized protein n=1 Tax=Micromonospora gifhornensis TaxID=84594 RepID=A0ABQ4IA78_9ACTN|nr:MULTISPECIES: hypothetical protein [Micromonospora]GIJ14721.1 hypothetical protein Vgi01_14050 [Micromonospora gifhornensis]
MINNNERIRIRRQMQRRIRDVVAERRRERLLETAPEPDAEPATDSQLTAV